MHTHAMERNTAATFAVKTPAAKISSDDWHVRAMCAGWHTVFKRTSQPDAAYSCPWCEADVR